MAEFKHEHPGEKEPRVDGEPRHEHREMGLKTASVAELADPLGSWPQRAQDPISARPTRTWEDVERIDGFNRWMMDDPKSGGARVGEPW